MMNRRAIVGLGMMMMAAWPLVVWSNAVQAAEKPGKKVVFVAGAASHGSGSHEHRAGCMLLADVLTRNMPGYRAVVTEGWPEDESVFEGADAVVFFADGGGGHYVNRHVDSFDQVMRRGVGLVCLHYAVEVPKGKAGQAMLNWTGGYFETDWSVNPHWKASFKTFPDHPVARGLKPFEIQDEWYYHMRFREGMENVTPILSALPPAETLNRPDGPHSNNPAVRKEVLEEKQPQHVGWAYQRGADYQSGRGFGFTGGHFHEAWKEDNFRRVVLNAIVWCARGEVPAGGVPSATPTAEQLAVNQDSQGSLGKKVFTFPQ